MKIYDRFSGDYTEHEIKILAAKYLFICESNEEFESFIETHQIIDIFFDPKEISNIKKTTRILTKLTKE